ncbi:MAG: 3'-5' exonuclease [Myxococcota bacterium]
MSRSRSYLVFDIETVPDDSLWRRPGDSSDHRERDAAVGHGRSDVRADSSGEWRPRDPSFPPPYAHVPIVLGWLWLDENYRMRELRVLSSESAAPGAPGAPAERQLLAEFSNFVDHNRPALVTYNGRAFDLPVIALRSLRHGVAMPWYYQDNGLRYRYSLEDHVDLCDWLADRGATRSGSLDALAKLIGLPGKLGVDGSQVEGLYRSGRLELIQRYCLADVVQTALLFVRFRLLQGVLAADEYRAIVVELTEQLGTDARVAEFMREVDGERLLAA